MIALLKSDLDMFPKISPKSFQLRFSTGYVEVITGRFEPHLNHELLKSLIINKYTILHREIAESDFEIMIGTNSRDTEGINLRVQ